ncbi:MAG: leucine-rich repeat domain-containing protein [Firmicutes bacterium]|nr:leucine-rich repeat domain-containing protein [Bacillota bacterium]
MYESRSKLSYPWNEDMVFEEHTTLFAVWNANANVPVVQLGEDRVTWNTVTNAIYRLSVKHPDGTLQSNIVPTVAGQYTILFSSLPVGDYEIGVTAQVGAAEYTSTIYYRNKALARVSVFSVIEPSTLVWRAVANATAYRIKVECGTASHNHAFVGNGNSLTYNFKNCDMKKGGIKFTVRAEASGFAYSESVPFVFERNLNAIAKFDFDETSETLFWEAVPNTSYYIVSVDCDDVNHVIDSADVYTTSVSLKECALGNVVVSVTPVTKGYNSPNANIYTYPKKTLATPGNIRVENVTAMWSETPDADGYEITVDGKVYPSPTNSFDLRDTDWSWAATGAPADVRVRAVGAKSSLWSDVVVFDDAVLGAISYWSNTVSWNHVYTATGYQVRLNNSVITDIPAGTNYYKIDLSRVGINTIEVRVAGSVAWTQRIDVLAYAVNFDTRSINGVVTRYYATGDKIDFDVESPGMTIVDWFDSPSGMGARYTDPRFTGMGDLTLYAYGTAKTYIITYKEDLDVDDTFEVTYGERYTLKVPVSDIPGDFFVGWFSQDGQIQYADSLGESLGVWTTTNNVDVYSQWITDVLVFVEITDAEEQIIAYSISGGTGANVLSAIAIPDYYLGKPVTTIGAGAFASPSLTTIFIGAEVNTISDTAFTSCLSLANIVVDDENVNFISGNGALFTRNIDLTPGELMFVPADIPVVEEEGAAIYTLAYGTEMTSEIVSKAFVVAKSKITHLVLSNSTTTIGENAFASLNNLTELTFGSAVAEIVYESEWFIVGGMVLYSSFGGRDFTSIFVHEDNTHFSDRNGVLFGREYPDVSTSAHTRLVHYPRGRSGGYQVPIGTTYIGENSFFRHPGLDEVQIPGSVTEIGDRAFYNCRALTEVFFWAGPGLQRIGTYTIDEQNTDVFAYCDALIDVTFENAYREVEIGGGAFRFYNRTSQASSIYFSNLLTINLPDGLTHIGAGAFSNNDKLTVLNIPSTNTYIGASAFWNCALVERINVYGLGSYSTQAFTGCDSITSITIPTSVTVIPSGAFQNLYSLVELIFTPGGTEDLTIEGTAFSCMAPTAATSNYSKLKGQQIGDTDDWELVFPARLKTLGAAFSGMLSVTAIRFEAGCRLEAIPDMAFRYNTAAPIAAFGGVTNLTTITFHEGLKTIGANAFRYHGNIGPTLTIPATVISIGDSAFIGLANATTAGAVLTTVTILGGTVFTATGNNAAFPTSVNFPNTLDLPDTFRYAGRVIIGFNTATSPTYPTVITNANFLTAYSAAGVLTIPAGVQRIAAGAFNNFTNIKSIDFTNVADSFVGFNNGTSDTTGAFSGCTGLTGITLPTSTIEVGNYTFARCTGLTGITLNNGLTRIGDYAFTASGLISITIPNSVIFNDNNTTQYVFANCAALAGVTLGSGTTVIPNYMFQNCTALTSVTMANSVELIGSNAFVGCRMLGTNGNITLPSSVRTIMASAFANTGFTHIISQKRLTELQAALPSPFGALVLNDGLNEVNPQFIKMTFNVTTYNSTHNRLVELTLPASVKEFGVTSNNTNFGANNNPFGTITATGEVNNTWMKLKRIDLGDSSIEYIGNMAFCLVFDSTEVRANSLNNPFETIILPKGLKALGSQAFMGCNKLQTISIPKTVEFLNWGLFQGCTSLTTVTFESGGTADLHLGIAATGVTASLNGAFNTNGTATSNRTQSAFGASGTSATPLRLGATLVTAVQVPARCVQIGPAFFASCNVAVTFEAHTEAQGARLKRIDGAAFVGNYMTSITLPATVTEMPRWNQMQASVNNYWHAFQGEGTTLTSGGISGAWGSHATITQTIITNQQSRPAGWETSWAPAPSARLIITWLP